MAIVNPTQPCPCTSGRILGECCGPYLAGGEPPDAVALMRSRYTAFALGVPGHLWRTLHATHADRARSEAELLRALEKASRTFKYRGLWILDHAESAPRAQVLFQVKLWQSGQDRSFLEKSEFLHDGTGWRYLSGELVPVSTVKGDAKALRLDTFPPK